MQRFSTIYCFSSGQKDTGINLKIRKKSFLYLIMTSLFSSEDRSNVSAKKKLLFKTQGLLLIGLFIYMLIIYQNTNIEGTYNNTVNSKSVSKR